MNYEQAYALYGKGSKAFQTLRNILLDAMPNMPGYSDDRTAAAEIKMIDLFGAGFAYSIPQASPAFTHMLIKHELLSADYFDLPEVFYSLMNNDTMHVNHIEIGLDKTVLKAIRKYVGKNRKPPEPKDDEETGQVEGSCPRCGMFTYLERDPYATNDIVCPACITESCREHK